GRVMAHALWDICSSAILLLGIYAISRVRRHWFIAVVLAIAVLSTKWSGDVIENEGLLLVNYGLSAIFFTFTACLLLIWKRWAIPWRYSGVGSRWRFGRKCWLTGPNAGQNRCACPMDLPPGIRRARWGPAHTSVRHDG